MNAPRTEAGRRVLPWLAAHYFNGGGLLPAEAHDKAEAQLAAIEQEAVADVLATLEKVLSYFEEACEYIAENPAEDDRLTAYMRRIDEARAVIEKLRYAG